MPIKSIFNQIIYVLIYANWINLKYEIINY